MGSCIARSIMEGCMSNLVKYLLFLTNFLIFVLGLVVFGLGIWVLVDKPSFLNLFDEAQKVSGISDEFNISIYTSAAYILLVVSFLVVLISFFGCCGAWKEDKCMLGYSGNLEETIEKPLKNAL